MTRWITFLLICFVHFSVRADEPNFTTVTGAATINADAQGRHWAYLVWSTTRAEDLLGRSLAIYSKAGPANAAGSYVREGIVTPVVSATVFAPLLQRAAALGDNLPVVDALLNGMVDHMDLQDKVPQGSRPTIARNLPLSNKLQSVLVKASQHPSVLQGIEQLKVRHPSIPLCLGRGWAGQIMNQVTTYEVREFDLATNEDIGVIGRVTLDWANPVVLSPPGQPVQVPVLATEGDLNIRLRWAVPDELRRLGPQVQGYSVWRCSWAYAQSHGWQTTAPSRADLAAALTAGEAERASTVYFRLGPNVTPVPLPVIPGEYFTPFQVTNFIYHPKTYFFADDNHRYDPLQPGAAFNDGDEFAYLVTARPLIPQPGTLLAGEGPPSIAGYGVACRTMPPDVPAQFKAETKFAFVGGAGPGGPGGENDGQHVRLSWQANDNSKTITLQAAVPPSTPAIIAPPVPTTSYQILRSTNIADFTSNDGGPQLSAIPDFNAAHVTDNATVTFDDLDVGANFNFYGRTVAYSLRAVRNSPCGPIYSAPSPPVFVKMRDYTGPNAPTGHVEKHCAAPFVGVPEVDFNTSVTPDGSVHFRVECVRRDKQISAVAFVVFDRITQQYRPDLGKANRSFAPHQNSVTHDFTNTHGDLTVSAIVRSTDGSISWPAAQMLGPVYDNTKLVKLRFLAGIVDPCGGAHGDPLALNAYGRAFVPGAAIVLPNGPGYVVTLSPAGGLVLDDGAEVTVVRNTPSGFPVLLGTATVTGNSISLLDNEAAGMTQEQLIARYRCYTTAKSSVSPIIGSPLNDGYTLQRFDFSDVINDGTQVCVVSVPPGGSQPRIHVPTSYTLIGAAEVHDNSIRFRDPNANIEASYHAFLFLGAMIPGSCPHITLAGLPPNETLMPVKIALECAPETVEYRIYRRVDEGPLTLIAQADVPPGSEGLIKVIRSDDSAPSVNCTLYYYGQTLDKNGNPSPLALLETIRLGVSSVTPLPTPMILPPKITVDGAGNSTLQVSWFCSTPGVDRFMVALASLKPDVSLPGTISIQLTQDLFDSATGQKQTFYLQEAVLTQRVGTGSMGAGPAFTLPIPVSNGNTYTVAVRALGPQKFSNEGFSQQIEGEFSQAATYTVPKTSTGTSGTPVPWPFRDLPDTTSNPFVTAQWLLTLDPGFPGNQFGRGSGAGVSFAAIFNDRGNLEPTEYFKANLFTGNPNTSVFTLPGTDAKHPSIKTLPVVLYRQQIRYSSPGVERPPAEQGAVVQASPLISKIAYSVVAGGPESGRSYLNDPAIGSFYYTSTKILSLHVLDKLPVTAGATYRYWLVHFNSQMEPDRIINAGNLSVPRS